MLDRHPSRRSTERDLVRWRRCGDTGAVTPVVLAAGMLFVFLLAFAVVVQLPPG
ncbi:MAG TPA: hypothetical protein VGD01_14185 [Candidatus Elarobacter sp.]